MKNVRARDYLGKTQVRLVASASSSDSTTHPGHRRNISADTWSKSDRAPHELSYAATNLVRSNLVSRSRQQSEPPIHRNVFPPTPPPEIEKPAPTRPEQQGGRSASGIGMRLDTYNVAKISPSSSAQTRSAPPVDAPRPPRSHSATRAAKPDKLELGAAAFETQKRETEQRRGATRSASERPAERRRDREYDRERARYRPSRERLFGAVEQDEGAEEAGQRLVRERERSRNGRSDGRRLDERRREADIAEEEEDEVIDDGPGVRASGSSLTSSTYPTSSTPGLKSLRVKVHYPAETRYIIMPANLGFKEFQGQIVKKFGEGLEERKLKIKTKDEEGDVITVGDEEDLEPCLAGVGRSARAEGSEVGRLEVSFFFGPLACASDKEGTEAAIGLLRQENVLTMTLQVWVQIV